MRLLSAELLRVLIRERDLSHRALAAAVGCSAGFISHLTAGRRTSCTADLASAIAEELDVPVALLFAPSLSVSARQNAAGDAA